jgi:hypothetical protein
MKRDSFAATLAMCLLATAARAQGTLFTGFQTDPLGAAALQIDSGTGFLLVSNIGSSGQDGMRAHHPNFMGFDCEIDLPPAVLSNMRMEMRAIGSVNGTPGQPLVIGVTENTPSGVELRTQFPAASGPAKRVEFRLKGQLIAAMDNVTSNHVASFAPSDAPSPWVFDSHWEAYVCDYTPAGMPIYCFREIKTFHPHWSDPIPYLGEVVFAGLNEVFVVDEVVTLSEPVPGTVVIDHTDLLLRNYPDALVRVQGGVLLDTHVIGIAGGALAEDQGALNVSNIGSSGLDGFAVATPDAESFLLELAGLPPPASLPTGARLELQPVGVLASQERQTIGALRVTKTPGPLALDVDLAGGTNLLVELFDQGNPIASAPKPAGEVLRFMPWPSRVGCGITIVGSPTGKLRWNGAVLLTIPGVGSFSADEARVSAVDASGPVAQIDFAEVTGRHLGSLLVTDVTSTPWPAPSSYCTAKTNSLGCTPAMGASGSPSDSIGDFALLASNIINQKTGIMIYGSAQAAIPFQGGYLCIQPPLRRTPPQSSGGSASGNDCTGAYSFAFTPAVAAAAAIVPGDTFCAQYWYRDSASPSTTGLTNGIEVTWLP